MKLWVDDMRPAPSGYKWIRSVHEAKIHICQLTKPDGSHCIEVLDLDHDAGDYAFMGGDYIELLNWMEAKGINDIPIHLHTQNPVGCENMQRIIEHNRWREV